MSFEGYDRYLCQNGHLTEIDVYDPINNEDLPCQICGTKMVWHETIDETNGNDPNSVTQLKIRTKRKLKRCKHCNCISVEKHETYKIPKRHRLKNENK